MPNMHTHDPEITAKVKQLVRRYLGYVVVIRETGSRFKGYARKRSDYDFIVILVNCDIKDIKEVVLDFYDAIPHHVRRCDRPTNTVAGLWILGEKVDVKFTSSWREFKAQQRDDERQQRENEQRQCDDTCEDCGRTLSSRHTSRGFTLCTRCHNGEMDMFG